MPVTPKRRNPDTPTHPFARKTARGPTPLTPPAAEEKWQQGAGKIVLRDMALPHNTERPGGLTRLPSSVTRGLSVLWRESEFAYTSHPRRFFSPTTHHARLGTLRAYDRPALYHRGTCSEFGISSYCHSITASISSLREQRLRVFRIVFYTKQAERNRSCGQMGSYQENASRHGEAGSL